MTANGKLPHLDRGFNMTNFKMQVFIIHSDYEQLLTTKRFNTFSLAKRYMSALRTRYEGDKFNCQVFRAKTMQS